MELKGKNVLVIGLGISGISIIKALEKLGSNIAIYDEKSEEELKNSLNLIEGISYNLYNSQNLDELDLEDIELVIKSPGVPPSMELLTQVRSRGIRIITDFELAYEISEYKNFITVTGTNGKTTVVNLLGEIFRNSGINTHVVGNIGKGILDVVFDEEKDDVYIIEGSSFQLNDIEKFQPKISLILNISPDHIDWHGSYDEYIKAKMNIFKNQDENDFTVLNYDDEILVEYKDNLKSNEIWFSSKKQLDKGVYFENDIIYLDSKPIISTDDIKLIGRHNIENIMGAIGVACAYNIPIDVIKDTISNFNGIEHRLEYVDTKSNIHFYNDSKGTNVLASIKAIEAVEDNIILLAGGYDKDVEFTDLISAFSGKVKELILFGKTRDKIRLAAEAAGFTNNHMVKNMEEAVDLAYRLAKDNYTVLLSPACASWGMYNNFEERGNDFKRCVHLIEE